jgi:ankyrin repeat protein
MKKSRWLKLAGVVAASSLLAAATSLTVPPSPIADAAMRNDVATVRKLITQGVNVNAAQGDGMTALHWAAEHSDSALAAALLKAHASVKATTTNGAYTPLHIAARTGSAAVVRELLAAGADAKAVTNTGATALHLAAAAGNPDAVLALIEKGADVNAREPEYGQTPLVFAAEYNRAAAIKVLIEHGANPSLHTSVIDMQQQAAREQAATKKRNEVLKSFEPKARADSADKEFAESQAKARSALASAQGGGRGGARGGRGGAAAAPLTAQDSAALITGAGGGARNNPLAKNATRPPRGPFTPEQIQAAIDSGRAVMMSRDAANGPAEEKVDTLNGGIAGFRNQVGGVGGMSALHHAARQGNVQAALALLDGGANINDTTNVDHSTPLLMAAISGNFDVAMKLVERGANVNLAADNGMTPLYATINTQWAPKSRYPQPQAVQVQKTGYIELMEALLKAGADPNTRIKQQPWYFAYNNCGNANCGLENIEGSTPFWRAAYSVDVDAMKLLVQYHADPTIPSEQAPKPARGGRGRGGFGEAAPLNMDPRVDSLAKIAPVGKGVPPLLAAAGVGYGEGYAGNSHRHAPDGWLPAVKYLVEVLHQDVNQRDLNGYTPLHHAAARGDNDMIKYLVAHGADVMAVSKNGRTVVDMANAPVSRLRPFPETIALLEKLGAINQHHCASC